jgi:hypothetical protein
LWGSHARPNIGRRGRPTRCLGGPAGVRRRAERRRRQAGAAAVARRRAAAALWLARPLTSTHFTAKRECVWHAGQVICHVRQSRVALALTGCRCEAASMRKAAANLRRRHQRGGRPWRRPTVAGSDVGAALRGGVAGLRAGLGVVLSAGNAGGPMMGRIRAAEAVSRGAAAAAAAWRFGSCRTRRARLGQDADNRALIGGVAAAGPAAVHHLQGLRSRRPASGAHTPPGAGHRNVFRPVIDDLYCSCKNCIIVSYTFRGNEGLHKGAGGNPQGSGRQGRRRGMALACMPRRCSSRRRLYSTPIVSQCVRLVFFRALRLYWAPKARRDHAIWFDTPGSRHYLAA